MKLHTSNEGDNGDGERGNNCSRLPRYNDYSHTIPSTSVNKTATWRIPKSGGCKPADRSSVQPWQLIPVMVGASSSHLCVFRTNILILPCLWQKPLFKAFSPRQGCLHFTVLFQSQYHARSLRSSKYTWIQLYPLVPFLMCGVCLFVHLWSLGALLFPF